MSSVEVSNEPKVERRGDVLVVTIDRQERMNALSQLDSSEGPTAFVERRGARCQ